MCGGLKPIVNKKIGHCQKERKRSHEMFQNLHCAVWVEMKVGFGPGLVKVLMFII